MAKGFWQNPRWCPFKIKKSPAPHLQMNIYRLSLFLTPVSFRWTITLSTDLSLWVAVGWVCVCFFSESTKLYLLQSLRTSIGPYTKTIMHGKAKRHSLPCSITKMMMRLCNRKLHKMSSRMCQNLPFNYEVGTEAIPLLKREFYYANGAFLWRRHFSFPS